MSDVEDLEPIDKAEAFAWQHGHICDSAGYCAKDEEEWPCQFFVDCIIISADAVQKAYDLMARIIATLDPECDFAPPQIQGLKSTLDCPRCGQKVSAGLPHPPSRFRQQVMELLGSESSHA
jgi:hypothetical protein